MVDSPTSRLRLSPPTVGGDLGTWGNTLNNDLSILDDAITGQTTITLTGLSTLTLTTADGATDQARYYSIAFIGSSSDAATCVITLPDSQKFYWILNACTNITLTLENSSSGNSASIPADGLYYLVYTDGTNVIFPTLGGQDASDWDGNQLLTLKSAVAKFGLADDITTIKSDITILQSSVSTLTSGLSDANTAISQESTARQSADDSLTNSINNTNTTVAQKANKSGDTFTGDVSINGQTTLQAGNGSVVISGSGHFEESGSYALLATQGGKITQTFTTIVASSGNTVNFPFAFSDIPDVILVFDCGNQSTFATIKTDKTTWTTTGFQVAMSAANREICVYASGTR